ncbi:SRP40, C-terminal domain containing protein [Tylopilus felleus]
MEGKATYETVSNPCSLPHKNVSITRAVAKTQTPRPRSPIPLMTPRPIRRTARILIQGRWSSEVVAHVPDANLDQFRRYLCENDDTSDSDDSSDESDKKTKGKKSPRKGAERDTSVTLSSVGENARVVIKQAIQIPEKVSTKDKKKSSELDSSDSDSSSESSASDSSDAETSSGSDSSKSSDSSDEDEANAKAPPNAKKTIENKSSSSSSLDSESDSESRQKEDAHVAKKRKTSDSGAAVTTAVATGSQQAASASQKEKPPPKDRERFQRVKVQNLAPEQFLNNGYQAKGGKSNDYGERAHHDLIVTRGAGFRKEKNKKKRGSYRGGEITMENHSIKFDF